MTRPVGVILAGGLSRRMGGGDKGLLTLAGQPVLSHVIARLRPQVDGLVLNANGDPGRFADFGLDVIADGISGFAGPLAGVLAGLDHAARHGHECIVTAAADTPFFPDNLVAHLAATAQDMPHPLVLAATPDPDRGQVRHPTFGLWPVALRDDLRHALQDGLRKVVLWTDRHQGREAVFPTDPFDPFFNINTPEDLNRAEALAEQMT